MNAFRFLLAAFFILAGTNHFLAPSICLSIVPTYLPWPETLQARMRLRKSAGTGP